MNLYINGGRGEIVEKMRFVIITGLSGAGKSQAVRCFEDLGYFCIDNLPPLLIPKFAELALQSEGKINRIALVSILGAESFLPVYRRRCKPWRKLAPLMKYCFWKPVTMF